MKRISSQMHTNIIRHTRAKNRKKFIRKLIIARKIERYPSPSPHTPYNTIYAPEILSLSKNSHETLSFFKSIRELSLFFDKSIAAGARRRTPFCINLSQIQRLSIRTALMLSAEVDRLSRICGIRFEYTGESKTPEDVTSILSELGALQLVTVRKAVNDDVSTNTRKTLIKLMSGRNLRDKQFDIFDESLKQVFSDYRSLPPLNEGMAEALLNVTHHAYLAELPLRYRCPGKRWWASACFDFERKELRVFVYDLGVGIPATLPYSGFKERIVSFAKGMINDLESEDDSVLLLAALQYARTRTGAQGRGKGFRDIMSAVDRTESSLLRIASGKAEVKYDGTKVSLSQRFDHHIGGTLVEWMLPSYIFDRKQGEDHDPN